MLSISVASEFSQVSSKALTETRHYRISKSGESTNLSTITFRAAKCVGCGFGSPLKHWGEKHVRPVNHLFGHLDDHLSQHLWDLYNNTWDILHPLNKLSSWPTNVFDDVLDHQILTMFPVLSTNTSNLRDAVERTAWALIDRYLTDFPSVSISCSDGHVMVVDRSIQVQGIKMILLGLTLLPITSNYYHVYNTAVDPKTDEERWVADRAVVKMYREFIRRIDPEILTDLMMFYGFKNSTQLSPLLSRIEHFNLYTLLSGENFYVQLAKARVAGIKLEKELEAKKVESAGNAKDN